MLVRAVRVGGGEAGAGAALCELLKYLAYQKLQVPYLYEMLRALARAPGPDPGPGPEPAARHRRTVRQAYDAMETMFKALKHELNSPQPPAEVCILFGATPVTCKEAYRLLLPNGYHKPQCAMDHMKAAQTLSANVLRTLTTSEIFEEMINKPLPLTNMFVLIKKTIDSTKTDPLVDPAHFVQSRGCRLPRNSKVAVIHLGKTSDLSCCSDFNIFEDLNGSADPNSSLKSLSANENWDIDCEKMCLIESTENEMWFQCNMVVKGFKDLCINGSSVTNQWLGHVGP